STQTGFYLQDQLALGNWHTILGVRHDRSTIDTDDRLWHGGFKQHDEANTFRVGSLYRFENGVAPYVTYAQSFQPTNRLSASGKPFKPSR
ncbi:TonB-dependent receptor, partial [Escherichia coli]|nr:TonB-dependent receptor [Escherichia coli]